MAEGLRAAFLRDGWAVTGPVLDDTTIALLNAGFDAVVDDAVRAARYPSREACLRVVQLWHDPWRVAPVYADLLASDTLLTLARSLLACDEVRLLAQRVVVKTPDGRTPLPWHRDLPEWPVADARGALIWLALDPVDGTTGGLRYISGSHGSDERPTGTDVATPTVPVGHALVHHPQVWHAASSNRSTAWRRACLVSVADARVHRKDGAAWDPARTPLLPWSPG